MGRPNLKLAGEPPPTERSPEREKLAKAIAHHAELIARLTANKAAQRKTQQRRSAAQEAVEKSSKLIEEAKANAAAHLTAVAMGSASEPPLSVKEARAQAQEAQDEADALIAASAALVEQGKATEAELQWSEVGLMDRIRDVLRTELPVEKMLADFAVVHRQFVEHRRALEWLEGQGAIPHNSSWHNEDHNWAGEERWKKAAAALASDADALLPAS